MGNGVELHISQAVLLFSHLPVCVFQILFVIALECTCPTPAVTTDAFV